MVTDEIKHAITRGEDAYNKGDWVSALRWYKTVADAGFPIAEFAIGGIYEEGGGGVAQNYALAAEWYKRAAAHGQADAQQRLASLYLLGKGVPQNIPEGVRLARSAAEQGIMYAQTGLAVLYENGQGVEQNLDEAIKWYRKAAAQGDEEALAALKRLHVSLQAEPDQIPSSGVRSLDVKGITLNTPSASIPDFFCERRMIDPVTQNYCGVRRFDNSNEWLRLYVTNQSGGQVYRIELFFKQNENLHKNTRLGAALISKYGSNFETMNVPMIKTIWAWKNLPPDTSLAVICGLQDGVGGTGTCSVRLVNDQLEKREQQAEASGRANAAPAPPKF